MIEIKNVAYSYGKKKYIEGLSLTLYDGDLTALLGTNGSGKTTLVRLITGELSVEEGAILIDGESREEADKYEMAKRLSYFPEGRPTPSLTVYELVALGRFPYTKGGFSLSERDKEAISFAMERAEITHFADRRLSTLSYGQRQSAYLAMLLSQEAKNALFDEPTNFLDEGARYKMLEKIKEQSRKGAVLVVLHDLPLAMSYADRIVLMSEGKIIADGRPSELYESGELEKALGVRLVRFTDKNRTLYATAKE